MTMTYDDSMRVLDRLKGGWSKRLSDDTFGIWLDELEPLDFSPAYAAARQLIRTSKYFPAISEFLSSYDDHQRAQAGPVEHTACTMCECGFVVTDEVTNTVVPCSKCNRDPYDAWAAGRAPKLKIPATHALFEPKDRGGPDAIDDIPGRVARLKALLEDRL